MSENNKNNNTPEVTQIDFINPSDNNLLEFLDYLTSSKFSITNKTQNKVIAKGFISNNEKPKTTEEHLKTLSYQVRDKKNSVDFVKKISNFIKENRDNFNSTEWSRIHGFLSNNNEPEIEKILLHMEKIIFLFNNIKKRKKELIDKKHIYNMGENEIVYTMHINKLMEFNPFSFKNVTIAYEGSRDDIDEVTHLRVVDYNIKKLLNDPVLVDNYENLKKVTNPHHNHYEIIRILTNYRFGDVTLFLPNGERSLNQEYFLASRFGIEFFSRLIATDAK